MWRDTTGNVRNTPDLPRKAVQRCGIIIGAHSDAAGMQEIAEVEDHADLKLGMPEKQWWWNEASGHEVPQAFRKKAFTPANDRELPSWASPFMDEQISDRIPGSNPDRYLSASFMHRRFPSGGLSKYPLCEIDTHLVNGAFSTPGQRGEEMRVPRFIQGTGNLQDFIMRVLEVGTISIVVKGDFNAGVRQLIHHMPLLPVNWLWDTGIDNIGIINAPRGHHIYPLKNGLSSLDNPSDHNQRTALLGMRRTPRTR